jgi:hypothetical protein
MQYEHKIGRRARRMLTVDCDPSSAPVFRDPEPAYVPPDQGREGESAEDRAFRRFPINSHKPRFE